jgi:glutaredoxin-like protein
MQAKKRRDGDSEVNGSLIDVRSREALIEKFQRELRNETDVFVFIGTENREYCDFTVQLCEELHEIDSRIRPTVFQNGDEKATELGITRTPTLLVGWDQGYKVKYTGAPAGQEAAGFIEAISRISSQDSGLQKDSKAKLRNVDLDVSIQVYVTPTCAYCPHAVLLAHQIAIETKG